MRCIDRSELERFRAGNLPADRLLAVDEHVRSCRACREALSCIPAGAAAAGALGMRVLGVEECPDYEQLSALVDQKFADAAVALIQSHVNACEECARDVARMRELRSHASMRDTVTVRPGYTVVARPARALWKRVLAGAAAAAVSGVLVFGFLRLAYQPAEEPVSVVTAPVPEEGVEPSRPEARPTAPVARTHTSQQPSAPAPETAQRPKPRQSPAEQAYTVVMVDGNYRIVERDGRRSIAGPDGKPIRANLDARAQAAIEEKLNTGTIKQPEPMVVAWNTLRSRPTGYTPPVTAPKLVSPVGRIIVDAAPVLKWSEVDMAHSYRVIVSDSEGNRIVDRVTDDTSLKLSEPLERGKVYLWLVGVKFTEGDVWSDSGAARFKVLSEEGYAAVESVKRQMPGSRLALGAVYEALGLYDEAAYQYRSLAKQNPGSAAEDLLREIPETP